MSLNDLKSEFSHTYVRAVAHAAGYFVQEANRILDGDGVDLMLLSRSTGGTVRSPRLDIQVKATAEPLTEDPFPFDLDVKNYDELRSDEWQVPRILVVVSVPADADAWVIASQKRLMLRRCGYWKSLRGDAATRNKARVRVRIDRSACFHVDQVRSIMDRLRNGGLP
jgi:hypothetical protein